VGHEVRAEELHDLPAEAGHDGADAQVSRGHLCRCEHPEGENEEADVREHRQQDRSDAKAGADVGAVGVRAGGQPRERSRHEHAGAEHGQQQQAAQPSGDGVRSPVTGVPPRPG
jgi:hypothetical protein